MKSMSEIHKTPHLIIGREGIDGFSGEIQFEKWKGSVIASWGGGWEHVSVSPYKRHITPSWDDMCRIKSMFWEDDECVVEYHPPKSEYVNNVPNCLHLWRPIEAELPMPPSIMVGIRKGQSMESARQEMKAVANNE